jgi:hypothetical protein
MFKPIYNRKNTACLALSALEPMSAKMDLDTDLGGSSSSWAITGNSLCMPSQA